jgi:hypothetical protein
MARWVLGERARIVLAPIAFIDSDLLSRELLER